MSTGRRIVARENAESVAVWVTASPGASGAADVTISVAATTRSWSGTHGETGWRRWDRSVAWWNLENLFDTDDDPISADFEFTVAQGWTPEVFAAKKANLAAVLRGVHGGQPPELLGVCEIEGDDVFADLLAQIGEPHLRVVEDPDGTADLRGIDVPVAFDDRKLRVIERRSHTVHLRYATRDIFEVVFELLDTGRAAGRDRGALAVAAAGPVRQRTVPHRRRGEHRVPGARPPSLRRAALPELAGSRGPCGGSGPVRHRF
jgi:Endonuclease/Exonuclease/phosphatase family